MINKVILIGDTQKTLFWSKVDKSSGNNCWNWTGAKKPKGYGNVRINKKYLLAHRVAWEIDTGMPVPDGLVVMHICDNPSCCNPSHLVLGTIKANFFDMVSKGREGFRKNRASGEGNGMSKLTQKAVVEIREKYKTGRYSQLELGNMYHVSQTTVGRVLNKNTWR